jgi:uroporphyrinogen III methyltransferase / synthase
VVESRTSPLTGKRIVITRAADQTDLLAEALRHAGALAQVLPLVRFAPPEDFTAMDAALRNLREFDWLFLTSQNAVRAVMARCAFLGVRVSDSAPGLRIATVGPVTAQAVEKAGSRVAHVASQHNGVALATELAAEVCGRRILVPRSDRANPDMLEVLKKLGARVTSVVAYRTLLTTEIDPASLEALTRGHADAILFFSPSAVFHLRELLGETSFRNLSASVVFLAIGPVTASALRDAGIHRVIASTDTTVAAAMESLAKCFSEAAQHATPGAKLS